MSKYHQDRPIVLEMAGQRDGDDFVVEHPTVSGALLTRAVSATLLTRADSGPLLTRAQIADDVSHSLTQRFLPDASGHRQALDVDSCFQGDKLLFPEYFTADTGQALGASHQTGWTALIATP